MNTLQRIEKLINEYQRKVSDCDDMLLYATGIPNLEESREERHKWNIRRQAYVTMIADLVSIVYLSGDTQ